MPRSATQLYKDAEALMNKGELTGPDKAIDLFAAAAATGSHTMHIRALQMKAICERMAGSIDAAIATFTEIDHVFDSSDRMSQSTRSKVMIDYRLRGSVKRDHAMVYIDVLDHDPKHPKAKEYLEKAEALLIQSRDLFEQADEPDAAELAVTKGYFGRLELVADNRQDAQRLLESADRMLMLQELQHKGNATYMVNNLRWLLRASSLRTRLIYYPRLKELTLETGQTSRLGEIKLLVLGNTIYTFMKRHEKQIKRLIGFIKK